MGVLTAEREHELEFCRGEKLKVDKICQRLMLGYVILGAAFFIFSLFATAAVSKDPSYKGPAKWFYGVDAAIWQVIFAAVTLVCGILGSMKHKIPGMMLFALFGGMLIWVAAGKHLTFRIGNLLLAGIGIAMTVYLFMQISRDDELKAVPGYPLFSAHIEENHEYRPSLVVTGRTASDHMESIEELTQKQQAQPAEQPEVSAAASRDVILPPEVQLSEWGEGQTETAAPQIPEQARKAAQGIALDGMSAAAEQKKPEEQLLSPEGILEDMGLHPSHAAIAGDESMLPDPDEVRRQLAAMKAAKERGKAQ